jgi:hypothetical protein
MESKMNRCFNGLMRRCLLAAVLLLPSACQTMSNALNPYYETPSGNALKGQPNDHALNDDGKTDEARQALEQMASYQRAANPDPYKPVYKPAIIRLMWVPDHLNAHGDLVPAHYYYVKVLTGSFAVSDAFELQGQLDPEKASAGTVPFVHENQRVGGKGRR